MSEYIIQTTNLTKRFKGRIAVDRVNLEIKSGEIYGFLGPNGAGKTTTIRMLLGLMKPSSGAIFIFGRQLKQDKLSILRKTGSLVESPSYYGHLTGYENLEAVRKILDVPKKRINEVLSIVRLTKDAKRAVKGYSLGMKQRLGIATALLGNPELLILDEPTNGLDPSGILEIRELIKNMPKEHGITVLVSSHLLSEIDQMATQVGVISKGSMIFQNSIETLRQRAKSKVHVAVSDANIAYRTMLANGYTVEQNESALLFDNITDFQVAHIIKTLVHENVSIYRVEEIKKSLEDIFLELVGEAGSL
ncbi:ATP-binding cassette domain-containing protein [Cytobacillus sp. IB215316]|uniref:ABC transporter ATP-binding protein n=1 Tax=Cytobacillus sp. IB215316 TaxID=3097354 RepID=UPI002A17C10D|nr:ATP-binding cassette domain-containing protein [Cytobacillus sp. IB215316]MDX8361590.1 ATP-binding cassette domain-containing protein [Cytobacillus sp. IB215316]